MVVGNLIVPLSIALGVHSTQVVAYTLFVYQLISIVAHHILEVPHLVHQAYNIPLLVVERNFPPPFDHVVQD